MESFCKVLIIDDEFIMRQGIKHMLEWEKEGFQIVGEASNGQEGLVLAEKLQPDIVLADIVMPVLDGIEFSRILQQKYPDIQLIVLSSYDKFDYVKAALLGGAVDYILKPTLNPEILLKALKKIVENIPGMKLRKNEKLSYTSQIERFILGYQNKLEESVFAQCFPHTLYRLFAINLKTLCNNQKNKLTKMQEMIQDFYDVHLEYVKLSVFLQEEILLFVFNYRVKDESRILADADSCAAKFSAIYEQAFFLLSRSFSNMQEIHNTYNKDVLEVINKQFYYKGRHLLVLNENKEKSKEEKFDFEKYTKCLAYKQFREALLEFHDYILYLCDKRVDAYKVKNLAKNLLYNYLMEIERYNIASDDLKQVYFERLDQSAYKEDFEEAFETIINELEELRVQKIEVEDVRILEIKRYIEMNYQKPLDLEKISKQFNFNYNYLSSYFNQRTKEGFSGYLNKIRIKHACELLRNSNQTIADISNKVGYSDHSYFCRVFKKTIGKTPSTYRRFHM